ARQAEIFGFEPPEVLLMDWPGTDMMLPDGRHTIMVRRGYFTNGQVQINGHSDGMLDDFAAVTGVLVHETTHAWQAVLAKRFKAGEIPPGAPEYQQASLFRANFTKGLYVESEADHSTYRDQPIELH